MKKVLLFILFFCCLSSLKAQIQIIESFDVGQGQWTAGPSGGFMETSQNACFGGAMSYSFWTGSRTRELISPNVVGQSNGTDLSLSFKYKIVQFSDPTQAGAADWGSLEVSYSTNGADWTEVTVINSTNHIESADCVQKNYTIPAADLPTGANFQLRFKGQWQSGNVFVIIDEVRALQQGAGVPQVAGTINGVNRNMALVVPNTNTDVALDTHLTWTQAAEAPTGYKLVVTKNGGTEIVNEDVGDFYSYYFSSDLEPLTTYQVKLTPYNTNGDATTPFQSSFTTRAMPLAGSTCDDPINISALPYIEMNTNTANYGDDYDGQTGCAAVTGNYLSGDDVVYKYTATSDATVNIELSNLSKVGVGIAVYTSCSDIGTNNCVDGIAGGTLNNGLKLENFAMTAGQTYYIVVATSSPPQSVTYDLAIYEPNCTGNIRAAFRLESACTSATSQFNVKVVVSNLGGASGVTISDNHGSTPMSVNAVGQYMFGPYTGNQEVKIKVQSNDNPNCFVLSSLLKQEYCPSVTLNCTETPYRASYCYDNAGYNVTYTNNGTEPLVLTVTGGKVEKYADKLIVYDSDLSTELYSGFGNAGDLSGLSFTSTGNKIRISIIANSSNSCQSEGYEPLSYVVSCSGTCQPFSVDYTTEGNCLAGQQEFFVKVNVTDMGGASGITFTDNQGSAAQNVTAVGELSFGPFANGTNVEVEGVSNDDANCFNFSGNLTRTYCQEVPVTCGTGPYRPAPYCYGNNEDYEVTYVSSDGSQLVLTVDSGRMALSGDKLTLLDSDGSVLYQGSGNTGNLATISAQSSSDRITLKITSDGSQSCQTNGGIITPLIYKVECAQCSIPSVDFNLVSACTDTANQFKVAVDIQNLNGVGSLSISDNQSSAAQVATTTGIVEFGPYPNGTDVQITVTNRDDANCVVTSEMITQAYCTEETIVCSSPITKDYCYGNNETYEVTYKSEDGVSPVKITFLEGNIAATDRLTILDSDGVTVLYENPTSATTYADLTGVIAESSGNKIIFKLVTDSNTNCQGLPAIKPMIYRVSCGGCSNPAASIAIDCYPASFYYNIVVDVTDMGGATSLTISDEDGLHSQVVTSPASGIQLGPYPYNTNTVISVANTDNPGCFIAKNVSAEIGDCAPAACLDAAPFCSQEGLLFPNVNKESTQVVVGAPQNIDYECLYTQPFPVWHFLKIKTPGDLRIKIVQNTSFTADGVPNGTGLDVDFIAWGPFNEVVEACQNLDPAHRVPNSTLGDGCSYSAAAVEYLGIQNAQEGEYYVIMITNFNERAGFISLQSEQLASQQGQTDCDILDEGYRYMCAEDTSVRLEPTETNDDYVYTWEKCDDAYGTGCNVIPGTAMGDVEHLDVEEEGFYRLSVYDINTGKTFVKVFTVIKKDEINPNLLPTEVSLCSTSSVDFDATPSNQAEYTNITYKWFKDGGHIVAATGPVYTATERGVYSVEITGEILGKRGTPTGVFCSTTKEILVKSADFQASLGSDQTFCNASRYVINARTTNLPDGQGVFTWYKDGVLINGAVTNRLEVTETGTYKVEIEHSGCAVSSEVNVAFYKAPKIDIQDVTVCDISTVSLDATPSNMNVSDVVYKWFKDGTEIVGETSATLVPTDYGTYTVEVAPVLDTTCATTKEIVISQRNDLSVEIASTESLTKEINYCEGDKVGVYTSSLTVKVSPESAVSSATYEWYEDGILIAGETDKTLQVRYDTEGIHKYNYTVKVSVDGCQLTSSVDTDVTIGKYVVPCKITQGLSPDASSGKNDSFDLSFLSDRSGITLLEIYNRHGRLVYKKSNYTNEWKGQDNDGKPLPTGTYYYVITFKEKDPVFGQQVREWIYLNRKSN